MDIRPYLNSQSLAQSRERAVAIIHINKVAQMSHVQPIHALDLGVIDRLYAQHFFVYLDDVEQLVSKAYRPDHFVSNHVQYDPRFLEQLALGALKVRAPLPLVVIDMALGQPPFPRLSLQYDEQLAHVLVHQNDATLLDVLHSERVLLALLMVCIHRSELRLQIFVCLS